MNDNGCAGIARYCDDSPVRAYKLAKLQNQPIRWLCGACHKSAEDNGYAPQSVARWLAVGQPKDMTGIAA